jgi:membrane protein YdbS with pleckstrin-like domain
LDIEKLEQLGRLRDAGILTTEEFVAAKANLLNPTGPSSAATMPLSRVPSQSNASEHSQSVSSPASSRQSSQNELTTEFDEQDVNTFRSSTIGWLFGSFSGWLTLLFTIGPIFIAANIQNDEWKIICFLLTALFLMRIFVKWVGNLSSKYELTTQRLILKKGLIFKRIDEIELFRVKDVRVEFSLLNQIIGIGKIVLRSSDSSIDPDMRDIPKAREVREIIRGLVARERQRRRVREVDDWEM